jgi:hypothetical protein
LVLIVSDTFDAGQSRPVPTVRVHTMTLKDLALALIVAIAMLASTAQPSHAATRGAHPTKPATEAKHAKATKAVKPARAPQHTGQASRGG